MNTQIATTIEQSQRLIACGVNPDSADMAWKEDLTSIRLEVLNHPWIENLRNLHYSPAWSLSALLELLPRKINDHDLETTPVLSPSRYSKGWIIEYIDGDVSDTLHSFRGFSLIEGCVLMIEWLTANGYTLNTK